MTTTRYFEWKVTGCKSCPKRIKAFGWMDCCNHESLVTTNDWEIRAKLYKQNKDQLTDSCPMAAQHKESETK